MGGKFAISIASSAFISFFAWMAVQLNRPLGVLLFSAALLLPPIVFREYYGKRPRMLVPFLVISLVLMIVLTPPPLTGPNVEFGLHQVTGCWEKNGDTWPIEGGADVLYSCEQFPGDSTVNVSGVAWRSARVELPVVGRFVTLYEPRGKVQKTYDEAVKHVESRGYTRLVEGYGSEDGLLNDALFIKGDECIYLAKFRVLGGGLAVVSARGRCPDVKAFALRRHEGYLWNATEPPIFKEHRFNWSSRGSVKAGRLKLSTWPEEWVRNTYNCIGVELKGTGYVKRMEGKRGDCRWSLWTRGGKSSYVALKGKEILVLVGETDAVRKAADGISPCGTANGHRVSGSTPEEVLDAVIGELNSTFELRPAEWTGPSPGWYLVRRDVRITISGGRNVSATLLIYALPEQCRHARYLMETSDWRVTSVCIKYGDYFVVVAVKGDLENVRAVLSLIPRPKGS